MALTDQQIVDLVDEEFENAQGAPGGDISIERGRAFDYYLRKLYGDEEEGSSAVVTSDVSECIDGIMPSLLRIFTTADNLVSFDAVGKLGPDGKVDQQRTRLDEMAAEQESDFVTHTFFKRNPAFEILFFWMFDALVQKNGYVKAWWDETEEITNESYEGLSEAEVLDLVDDDELEGVERSERIAETVVNGQITHETVHDIKFKRTRKVGKVTIENVPPDEFRISGDSRSLDPSKARMVGHEREVTRAELLAMGFDKKIVDELPAGDEALNSSEKTARRDKSDDQKTRSKNTDKSQDKILLREAYIDVDINENGKAELKQVFTADSKKLEISDADRQPFHSICPHPLPHKHFGLASSEKVMDVQRVTSQLIRQVLDNLYRTNQPGHGVWEGGMGENTMDDLLTTKVGRVARFKRPVNESYTPMTVPFTAAESFPMVEYFDKVKKDRTGISSDSEGLSPEALKNIQQSVMASATDLGKMKIEAIARVFAETGFKSLFRHVRELLQKHQQKAEVVKLRGIWVPIKPSSWKTRNDMTVHIGLGIGTRQQNLIHLDAIKQIQGEMIGAGGMNLTVTPKNVYNMASEFVKNANLNDPAMYFTDPGDKPAPPPSSEQEELKKKEQQLQERQQQLDGERNQVNSAKIQLQAQEQSLNDRREMLKIEEKAADREDKFAAENEKLRNELIALQLKAEDADADRELKSITALADAEKKEAETVKVRAETVKIVSEVDAQDIENAAAESGIEKMVGELGETETTE